MVRNVLLMKLTHEGARHIKDAPARIKASVDAFEALGGKVIAFYAVTGDYDYIAIGEAPSDEVSLTFLAGLAAQGTVTSKTLRAFTVEEFTTALAKLPG